MIVKVFDAVVARLERIPLAVIQLVMRVAVGAVFFNAGLLKYRSPELTALLFRDEYKVPLLDPALAASMATFNELTFSTLLFLGLATRVATLPFLGMIAVIQTFVYPQAWVEHLTWASILVFLLTRGPGRHLPRPLYPAARRAGLKPNNRPGEIVMQTHPTLSSAILGGIAGTAIMTAMMYMVAPMMGIHMDIAAMLGSMMGGSWTAGMMVHIMNGAVVFPAVYAFGLYAFLPGPPLAKGLAWGAALWLVAQVVVMPMMGGGLFSSASGGMMAAGGSLMGHLFYGGALGLIAVEPKALAARA